MMQGIHRPYGFIKRALLYAQFLATAKSWKSVHSPFIFELAKHVVKGPFDKSGYTAIESLRKRLQNDKREITFKDYGADGVERTKTIASIAKKSAKAQKQCVSLAKIVSHLQPEVALELGTSLGISYAYMVTASPNTTFVTIEGGKAIAEVASENLSELGLFGNVKVGTFKSQLPQIFEQMGSVDFVYVDGHHQLSSTLEYFHLIAENLAENGCIVFDDIYWSEGMTEAWHRIRADKRVTLSIDCFHFGLAFFRNGATKQHFKLLL